MSKRIFENELESKKNKLQLIYATMQEYHNFMAQVQFIFDETRIKCETINPAIISQHPRILHDVAMKESIKLEHAINCEIKNNSE